MRICILNSETKLVENVLNIKYPIENFVPEPGTELAPQSDGEIGWTWNGNGWNVVISKPLDELERQRRDKFLQIHVDIMNAVRWESLTQQQKDDFISYRQALLDVPQQPEFPYNITWPVPPQI